MAVLGDVLSLNTALAEVAEIAAPRSFYRPAHQMVMEAALALRDRGDPWDAIAVGHELQRRGQFRGGLDASYLHTLTASASFSPAYYAGIVAEQARRRERIEHLERALRDARNPAVTLADVEARLAAQLAEHAASAVRVGLGVVDLEPAAEDTSLPVLICGDRLYRGAVHTLSGPPDCGKTTLACWWMLQAVREEGGVLFLDEEGGREIVTEKFQALGAKPGERIGYVAFPSRSWAAEDVAMLSAALDERKPAIVAWDSSAAFLARAGLDENAAADVTRFYAQVLTLAARRHDAAVLVIDHDTKSSEPSRYSRGSGAKLAATDVAYKITPVTPFSKADSGMSRLTVAKDRRGWLDRAHEVVFLADGSVDVPLTVSISAATGQPGPGQPDMPPARAKLLAVLDFTPATVRELVDRVEKANGHGLKRETASRELNALLVDGLADHIEQGIGKPTFWMLNRRSNP